MCSKDEVIQEMKEKIQKIHNLIQNKLNSETTSCAISDDEKSLNDKKNK
ncbi:hypothetical protein AB837_00573 [bacterium AB1]|nr:hypothetical protein AB837_00573 [bacterium AB1]